MTQFQKVIKYFALILAFLIIFNIVTGIFLIINSLSGILNLRTNEKDLGSLEEIISNIESGDIATLKVELKYSNLKIKKGDHLKAESNDPNITCKQHNNQLIIREKGYNLFHHDLRELVIYVPEDLVFEAVKIESSAGRVDIVQLNTKNLYFEMGAGKTKIDTLNVYENTEIDGGIGEITISDGKMNNLELDLGVGSTFITTDLTGRAEINAGVGKLNIKLDKDIENYKFKVDKGLGLIKINDKEISKSTRYGKGATCVEINGGIGKIEIANKKE